MISTKCERLLQKLQSLLQHDGDGREVLLVAAALVNEADKTGPGSVLRNRATLFHELTSAESPFDAARQAACDAVAALRRRKDLSDAEMQLAIRHIELPGGDRRDRNRFLKIEEFLADPDDIRWHFAEAMEQVDELKQLGHGQGQGGGQGQRA